MSPHWRCINKVDTQKNSRRLGSISKNAVYFELTKVGPIVPSEQKTARKGRHAINSHRNKSSAVISITKRSNKSSLSLSHTHTLTLQLQSGTLTSPTWISPGAGKKNASKDANRRFSHLQNANHRRGARVCQYVADTANKSQRAVCVWLSCT